jgi:hypothetical protein
MEDSAA